MHLEKKCLLKSSYEKSKYLFSEILLKGTQRKNQFREIFQLNALRAWKLIRAKISSRENYFMRKLVHAKISARENKSPTVHSQEIGVQVHNIQMRDHVNS